MRFIKTIKFDLKYGILKKWYLFVIYAFFVFLVLFQFSNTLKNFEISQFTLGDCYMCFFSGIKEYIPTPNETLKIPYMWLLCFLFVCYFTVHYMHDDLSGIGQQIILRCKTRKIWWLSKCFWNLCFVFLCFAIINVTVLLFAVINKCEMTFNITESTGIFLEFYGMKPCDTWNLGVLQTIILPFAACCAVSLLQMLISLLIRPLVAYIISVVVFFAGIYKLSPWLIGNYAMILRFDNVAFKGVDTIFGLILCVVTIAFCVFGGMIFFRKHNILGRD